MRRQQATNSEFLVLPILVSACAFVGACSGGGGGGGGGDSPGSGWGAPFLLDDVELVDDIGMDAAGNVLLLYESFYKIHDGAWTTGTHGLSGATIDVGGSGGVLVGRGLGQSIQAHIFRNGALEPVEMLVTATNAASFGVAIASENGAAAAWIEGDLDIVLRAWDAAGGWGPPLTLARTETCDYLAATSIDDDSFVLAWQEALSGGGSATMASVLESGSWSAAETLSVYEPLALETLSDGRVLLVAASDSTYDNASVSIYASGIGWSDPEILDIGAYEVTVDADDHGDAVIKSGSKIARFDGASWTVLPVADDAYATGTEAFEMQANGEGFGFAVCSEQIDYYVLYACLFPFDGSSFGTPEFLTEGSYYLGDSTLTGTALNDAGHGIVTWTAPTETAGTVYRTWGSFRD